MVGHLFTWGQTVLVQDAESGAPLIGVTFTSKNPKTSVITNAVGKADLSSFSQTAPVEIRYIGYHTLTLSYREIADANFTILMNSAGLELDEVVISATRWRQSKLVLPSSITTITPKEVALQNPQTAADLLGISGKVFIQKSQQGGGSPMIRGFATNRLIYTVDGVRMNTAIFRGGNIQNVINLDPFATESTEVLFGPGSVIYGSDAIGGVMSFQTITPTFSQEKKPLLFGRTFTRFSSANQEKTGHLDVRAGWEKWALVTSFSSWNYDDLKQGSRGPEAYIKDYYVQRIQNEDVVIQQNDPLLQIPTGYSQVNLMQKVRFKPGENWDLQYGFHYSETSPYGRYDRHNRQRNGTARYAEWDYGPQKWLMHNVSAAHSSHSKLYDQLVLRLAQQEFTESRISRNLNNPNREIQTENVTAYSVNLDFQKSGTSGNNLFYGLEWVQNDVLSKGETRDILTGSANLGPSRYPVSVWNSIAAYFSKEFQFNEKWNLQSGIRYNLFALDANFSNNTEFYPFPFTKAKIADGSLTGHIGTVYRPHKQWVLKANLGTAFRAPNVDDIGKVFDSEPGSVTVPNPNLKAEYAWNADLGIAHKVSERVKIELSGYYTLLENAMVRRDYKLAGLDSIMYDGSMSKVQAIQNAALAKIHGVQAGIEIKLPKGFGFSSDLNWQKGEEELDDGSVSPARHAAPFFGISRLTYVAKKLEIQLNSQFQGKMRADQLPAEERAKTEIYAQDPQGNNYAPAWNTINLKTQYQISNTFELGAGLENITDQRYRPYSSGISGAGRNFILSLNAHF
ncbi:MAG: hypothetical protein RLZZ241_475 [Bacteroidota bacterium]|jgi:hemoglobin/transferrin/lactoferrin receptor protein